MFELVYYFIFFSLMHNIDEMVSMCKILHKHCFSVFFFLQDFVAQESTIFDQEELSEGLRDEL